MSLLTTSEFEDKIKMWIRYSEARPGLNMSPFTGKPFECGCGKIHNYNNLHSPPFMDGGMYKMALMVKECKHLKGHKILKDNYVMVVKEIKKAAKKQGV